MNYLIHKIAITENEGTAFIQTLNAVVDLNPDKEEEDEPGAYFRVWATHGSKGDDGPFTAETAIALRDFLNFCFPPSKDAHDLSPNQQRDCLHSTRLPPTHR